MRSSLSLVLLAGTVLVACSSTNYISGAGSLRHGHHRDAFDAAGERIGPGSQLRFCQPDGCSDWVHASDLRVDDTGAWLGSSKAGYAWKDVSWIEVKSFNGVATMGAIIGITAAVAAVIPIIVIASTLRTIPDALPGGGGGGGGTSRGHTSYPEATIAAGIAGAAIEGATTADAAPATNSSYYWPARARTTGSPERLFTLGARVRNVITVGASSDGYAAYDGSLYGTTALARLRLGNFLELGAGARLVREHANNDWTFSKLYVAQGGFHGALTARFGLALGLDIAWGDDELARDISIPWGFRYTSPSGRYTATLRPGTPTWTRHATGRNGVIPDYRFAMAGGIELGATL